MTGSLALVGTGHCAAGALTWAAWSVLRDAGQVLGAETVGDSWEQAFADAGVQLSRVAPMPPDELATRLVATAAAGEDLVWFVAPDGNPGLAEALTRELVRRSSAGVPLPQVEMVLGSWDEPGAGVLELVEVMNRLRSPGGCPWDAEQTHASLLPYVLEEAYEVAEAIEQGDPSALAEELGDLLLQVVFHARVAQDSADPFDIDDVAAGILAKLRRRHPHVFADAHAPTAAHVEASWAAIKAGEKGRKSVLDGVPVALPALARAQKVLSRVDRAGLEVLPVPDRRDQGDPAALGDAVLAMVEAGRRAGTDVEGAVRQAVRRLEGRARAAERARGAAAADRQP